MEKHVYILFGHYDNAQYVRGVFVSHKEATRAKKAMEAKRLNFIYSIGTYQLWESLEQAQAEERI